MDSTIFLAQFWGWLSVITAMVYLLRGSPFLDELLTMHEDKGFVFLSGWVLLALGLITIILHHVWVADWRVIITITGWASTFKGVTRMGFPEATQKLTDAILRNRIWRFRIAMAVVGFLGLWLTWMTWD
ncbi:MAG: hypothetical protein JSW66_03795 [Phycisphaerales bacterium]|nr:MAG: hypothetical protein JSW66_03795 [Phycisphaerales bacterium]